MPNPANQIDLPKHLQFFVVDRRLGRPRSEHLVVGIIPHQGHVAWLVFSTNYNKYMVASDYMSSELEEFI